MSQQPILLDTNIFSIFAELGKTDLLLAVLNQHLLFVSPTVYTELSVGLSRGHTHLRYALDLVGENKSINVAILTSEEANSLKTLPAWLGSGEAESIVVCQSRGWIFASYDRKAVNYCKNRAIFTLTLNDILAAIWQGNIVSKDDVTEMIRQLEAGGRIIKAKEDILKD
jgi:predicted nucleic acid-binding protein